MKLGHSMRKKTKKDKLETAWAAFDEKKVLLIADLINIFGITSKRSVLRYMKNMDYLVSYSHAGQYYTLRKLVQFDADGLWHYGEIGFSKHGTLLDTITHLVGESESGMTNAEIQQDCCLLRGALNSSGFLDCISRMAACHEVLDDMRLLLSHFEVLV